MLTPNIWLDIITTIFFAVCLKYNEIARVNNDEKWMLITVKGCGRDERWGKKEGAIGKFSNIKFHTNSNNTPIIQENQQIIFHLISEYLDKNFKW